MISERSTTELVPHHKEKKKVKKYQFSGLGDGEGGAYWVFYGICFRLLKLLLLEEFRVATVMEKSWNFWYS